MVKEVWATNALVEWQPPRDDGNSEVTGYLVQKADKKTMVREKRALGGWEGTEGFGGLGGLEEMLVALAEWRGAVGFTAGRLRLGDRAIESEWAGLERQAVSSVPTCVLHVLAFPDPRSGSMFMNTIATPAAQCPISLWVMSTTSESSARTSAVSATHLVSPRTQLESSRQVQSLAAWL